MTKELLTAEYPNEREIIEKIENYLKQKPDQTPHVADVDIVKAPDIKGLNAAIKKLSGNFLKDRKVFEHDSMEVNSADDKVTISLSRASSNFEKLIFSLEQVNPQENSGKNIISLFVTSLCNKPDATDEYIPRTPDQVYDFFQAEKDVFKIRHRFVEPKYRRQNIGNKMLKAVETFAGAYADHFQKDKLVIATTAQLDVILFFLKNGYKVSERDREEMMKILEFIDYDLRNEPHPTLRRSVSNYIIPQGISDEEFVHNKEQPFGHGVDVDLTRKEQGGVAVTLQKNIPFHPRRIPQLIRILKRTVSSILKV